MARWHWWSLRACERCRVDWRMRATPSRGPTSTTPCGRRSAEPADRRTPRRADDRLLGDPGQGIRCRAADVGVLPLLLCGADPVAGGARRAAIEPPAPAGVPRRRPLRHRPGLLALLDRLHRRR